jgi:hypothetical protein
VNRSAVIIAAAHFLDRVGEKVSRRSIACFLKRNLGKSFSWSEIDETLAKSAFRAIQVQLGSSAGPVGDQAGSSAGPVGDQARSSTRAQIDTFRSSAGPVGDQARSSAGPVGDQARSARARVAKVLDLDTYGVQDVSETNVSTTSSATEAQKIEKPKRVGRKPSEADLAAYELLAEAVKIVWRYVAVPFTQVQWRQRNKAAALALLAGGHDQAEILRVLEVRYTHPKAKPWYGKSHSLDKLGDQWPALLGFADESENVEGYVPPDPFEHGGKSWLPEVMECTDREEMNAQIHATRPAFLVKRLAEEAAQRARQANAGIAC